MKHEVSKIKIDFSTIDLTKKNLMVKENALVRNMSDIRLTFDIQMDASNEKHSSLIITLVRPPTVPQRQEEQHSKQFYFIHCH